MIRKNKSVKKIFLSVDLWSDILFNFPEKCLFVGMFSIGQPA
jgi:hypothetical protein